jgi:hypothetical protein
MALDIYGFDITLLSHGHGITGNIHRRMGGNRSFQHTLSISQHGSGEGRHASCTIIISLYIFRTARGMAVVRGFFSLQFRF